MSTGQTMITILAMLLLSITIVTVNRGLLTTNGTMYQNRTDIVAVSLANSILEDASSLAFDQNSTPDPITGQSKAITLKSQLTPVSGLGIETSKGESRNNPNQFNDFDDYNCYRTIPKEDSIDVPGSAKKMKFYTLCSVDYVDPATPNTASSAQTWHKRIRLRIWHPNMAHDPADKNKSTDTIKVSCIYSYWYFR